eukprot:12494621-Heterocapsa_arctica.AAC.1
MQWRPIWRTAPDRLLDMHEQEQHVFPLDFVQDTWEELWWRWTEEIKGIDRDVLRKLGQDNPRYDQL